MNTPSHEHYMAAALALAEKGRCTVSPNPMVGCIIVKNNRVIGEGFHERAGCAHAEVNALASAGTEAAGATAYVTLEPCCHHGKTPPCTEALIKAGIQQVYVACLDPNPLVAGKGIHALQKAGIIVNIGLREMEAKQLNEIFFHFMLHHTPFVIAKWAMSLDGRTTTHAQDDRKISNASSHQHAHALRQQVDAILIGAKTVMLDNPLLTVRHTNQQTTAKQLLRIILASHGQLPFDLNVFNTTLPGKTLIVATDQIDPSWHRQAKEKNIEILIVAKNNTSQIDLPSLLLELGKRNITSLLVEGGKQIHDGFFKENLVNKIHVYLAPTIIGNLEKKYPLTNVQFTHMNGDYYFSADYKR